MAQKERALPLPLAEELTSNRAYFDDIVGMLARGIDMPPDSPVFRDSSGGIYEVWDDIEIVVPYVTMTQKGPKLHAAIWVAEAGDALLPIMREATEAELLCLGTRRQYTVPHRFVSIGQEVLVRILAHHEDALSVWRQLARHIPATYLGRRYRIQNEPVIVPGRIDTIRLLLDLLTEAEKDLAKNIGNVDETRQQAVRDMAELAAVSLERRQTLPQVTARQALTEIEHDETSEGMLDCIFRARGALAAEELHHAAIVQAELDRATKLVKMLHRIQEGTDHAFIALGKLTREVFELFEAVMRDDISPRTLQRVAGFGRRARNLHARFIRVCAFKPWREPVFSERGLGLRHAADVLSTPNVKPVASVLVNELGTALRFLTNALSAYEKLVEGEGPEKGEITRIKRWYATATKGIPS